MFNSIRDEACQLSLLIPMEMSATNLVPILQRLLEMSSSIMKLFRGAMAIEVRLQAIECFGFVWNSLSFNKQNMMLGFNLIQIHAICRVCLINHIAEFTILVAY